MFGRCEGRSRSSALACLLQVVVDGDDAEVFDRLDDARSEVRLPETIDGDARDERVPAGRAEASLLGILGATGYTGRLTARELAAAGARPVLAGRDPRRLEALAGELGGLEAAVAATSPDGETSQHEARVIWPDGAVHWYDSRWRLVVDEDGRGTIVGIARLVDAEHTALQQTRLLADISAALDASLRARFEAARKRLRPNWACRSSGVCHCRKRSVRRRMRAIRPPRATGLRRTTVRDAVARLAERGHGEVALPSGPGTTPGPAGVAQPRPIGQHHRGGAQRPPPAHWAARAPAPAPH